MYSQPRNDYSNLGNTPNRGFDNMQSEAVSVCQENGVWITRCSPRLQMRPPFTEGHNYNAGQLVSASSRTVDIDVDFSRSSASVPRTEADFRLVDRN